jgi:hypothetical protein
MLLREINTTVQNAARIAELEDKEGGYPVRGTNIGNGIFPTIQETWDSTGPVPIGWSSHRAGVSGSTYRTATGAAWVAANGPALRLTPVERLERISLLALGRRASSRWSVRAW